MDRDKRVMSSLFAIDMKTEGDALEALAREGGRKSRAELTRSIVRMFSRPELFLGVRERAIAYDILQKLIDQIEGAVRRDVAAAAAVQRDAPRALVRALAHDEIDVAFAVLAQSPVLTDEDLVEVIHARTIEHHLAIVDRPALSAQVSDALVATDSEEVVVALLRNKAAEISPKSMEHLVNRSRDVTSYRNPILDRDDLDSAMAMRMFFWVSTVLRDRIVEKFNLEADVVDEMIAQMVRNEVRQVAAEKRSREEVSAELKVLMQRDGILNADMLMIALREGETPMFTSMFGKMAALDHTTVGRLLFEHDGKGMAIACRAVGISRIGFISIFALAQKLRGENDNAIHRRLPAALEIYDLFPIEAAEQVLGQWRKGVEYASAIRTGEYKLRRGGG